MSRERLAGASFSKAFHLRALASKAGSMPRTDRNVLDVGMSRVFRFTILSVEVAGRSLFPSQSCDVPREATHAWNIN